MDARKYFVYLTLVCAVALFTGAAVNSSPAQEPMEIASLSHDTFPTLGSTDARVELLLIEDLKCKHCKNFSEKFFPRLVSKYLEEGKVRFTLVPLAFLRGSKPLANAALAVYDLAPERFLPFILELFQRIHLQKKELSVEIMLVEIAQKVGGIQISKFRECIRTRCHEDELDRNFEWAKQLMGEDFGTPALYLNGTYISPSLYPTIWQRIDAAIQEAHTP